MPVDSPLRFILLDYCKALGALLSIINATLKFVDTIFEPQNNYTYGKYEKEITRPELRALRLHDLVGKLANDKWLRRIFSYLDKNSNQIYKIKPVPRVSYKAFFTNSQPGLELEISAQNGFFIGIQIQGGKYRHYVRCQRNRNDLEQRIIKSKLLNSWFYTQVFDQNLQGRQNQAHGALTNLFAFTRTKFLYSALNLQNINLHAVEHAIIKSMCLAAQLAEDQQLWNE